MHLYNNLNWRERSGPDGKGRLAFAVLDGNRTTGGIWVAAAIERTSAPKHQHGSGPEGKNLTYGELVITASGELFDNDVVHHPGCVFFHPPGSVHEPRAPRFWWGFYHQPYGSTELPSD